MEQTPQSNPFAGMHKQRLYSLIIAGVALLTLLLPWVTFGFYSQNGFRGWGILSLLGILAAAGSVFSGNKTMAFDNMMKKISLGAFGAISLGALIFVLTKDSNYTPFAGLGFGVWVCLAAGVAGLAILLGFIKIPQSK